MVWTNPTTRAVGYVVPSSVWNEELVDNLEFLHDRVVTKFYPLTIRTGALRSIWGVHTTAESNGQTSYFEFVVPDDFDTLLGFEIAVLQNQTRTTSFTFVSSYGNPALGENYATHSSTVAGLPLNMVANILQWADASGTVPNLSAGDLCGISATQISGHTEVVIIGLRLIYLRS